MTKKELGYLTGRYLTEIPKFYWDRKPGCFVNKVTGKNIETGNYSFTGSVREWYETLMETIVDMVNMLGSSCSISVSSDVDIILASTVLYKPFFMYDKEGKLLQNEFGEPLNHETLKGLLCHGIKVYLSEDQSRNKILVFSNDQTKFGIVEVLNMDII